MTTNALSVSSVKLTDSTSLKLDVSSDIFVPKIFEIIQKNVIANDFEKLDLELRKIKLTKKEFSIESIHYLIQQIKDSESLKKSSSIIYRHMILNLGIPAKCNVPEFPKLDKELRLACAKLDLESNAFNFCLNIQKYGIENQETLIDLGKAAAKIDGKALSKYIGNFGIENQDALIDIAKIALEQDGAAVARHIKNYRIKSKEVLIDIAKLVAAQEGEAIAKYIQNFEIKDQKALCEIAKIAAEDNGEAVSEHIKNFHLHDENARYEVACIAMDQNAIKTCEFLRNYTLTKMDCQIPLFLRALHQYPEAAQYINHFFPDKSNALKNYPELRLFGFTDNFNISKFLFDLWEVDGVPCSLISKPNTEYAKTIKENDSATKDAKVRWLQFQCCVLDFAKDSPLFFNELSDLLKVLEKEDNLLVKHQKMNWIAILIMLSRFNRIQADTVFNHLFP